MDNITDEQLNQLTQLVLDRLLKRGNAPDWHQMNTPLTINEILKGTIPFRETPEEFLISELARLSTLLNMYEDQEEYMKAAIIKRRISIVENRLNKL